MLTLSFVTRVSCERWTQRGGHSSISWLLLSALTYNCRGVCRWLVISVACKHSPRLNLDWNSSQSEILGFSLNLPRYLMMMVNWTLPFFLHLPPYWNLIFKILFLPQTIIVISQRLKFSLKLALFRNYYSTYIFFNLYVSVSKYCNPNKIYNFLEIWYRVSSTY